MLYRMMKTLKVSELPPLVYQLLVLSRKGHRSMVLEGIKLLFYQLDQDILEAPEEVMDRYVAEIWRFLYYVCVCAS